MNTKTLKRARTHDVAFQYRMPAGIPGAVTRTESATVEPGVLDTTNYPLVFGVPVASDASSKNIRAIMAGDTSASIYGLYVRPYPLTGNGTDGLGTSTPPVKGLCNVLKRGYMSVVLGGTAAAAKNAPVYVRVGNASSGKVVGDIEAAADVTVAGGTITGTGTGTIAASVAATATPGTWSLVLQTTSQTSLVTVIDPLGVRHKDAIVGTAYTSGGLTFTITAAGTMTAADSFAPVVTANTVVMPNAYFTGPGDANSITEVAYNL